MKGLVNAAALVRVLNPVRLSGKEIKFIRRALGLTQKVFAARMDVAVETISRWENYITGCGGFTEKTLRHNACALLHPNAPAIDYDPIAITNMTLEPQRAIEPVALERVRVKMPCQRFEGWDQAA
jgi:transcriptional regulator with XRE-family HTH domain